MISRAEVLRYLGAPTDSGIETILDAAINAATKLSPKHLVSEYCVKSITADGVNLEEGLCLCGELAKNSLNGCKKVLIIIATLTLDGDRLIATAGSTAAKAVVNATLSAAIEDYVDTVNAKLEAEYKEQGLYLTTRFSPGYGDLPLSLQRDLIFAANADKLLGISVTENMLLVPVKTVTAVIGISDTQHDAKKHKCADCTKNCIYRR